MAVGPVVDPVSPLQFVINAAAGSSDAHTKREVIESALRAAGRRGELLFSRPARLARVAQEAATRAIATRAAVVAVGGDGTLHTVAQAAHAAGCAMGVVPQGTFNYFARTHGIPADPAEAARQLLVWTPAPVQVAAVNDRVFLVNASLGCTPTCLKTARRTRRDSAAAGGWRSGRHAPRCCARNGNCACTSNRVRRFATCAR